MIALVAFVVGLWCVFHLALRPFGSDITHASDYPYQYSAAVGAVYQGTGDVVLQTTDSTCGPAALAYILQRHGETLTEADLAKASGTTQQGTSLLSLAQVANRYGYRTNGVRLSYEKLRQLPMPAIVFMPRRQHFVAVAYIDSDTVLVADPLVGYLRYTKSSFLKHWDGVVLTVTKRNERGGFDGSDGKE